MNGRKTSLFLLAAVFALTAGAGTPVLETVLTPPESPYHRTALYAVSVEASPETQVDFPDIAGEENQVEIRKTDRTSTPVSEDVLRHTQYYRVDPIAPGTYVLPPLTVSWSESGTSGTLTVPPAALNARQLTPAETEAAAQFAGITAPAAVLPPKAPARRMWLTGGGIVLAAALAALALWRYLRRSAPVVAPALPAWEVALNRLRELNQRDLPATGKLDIFYVDLSSILRYYVEDRFRIRAPEQTTQEFIEDAASQGVFSEVQQQFLAEFLRQCDRIKFARLQPGLEDAMEHFKQVRLFVKETIPAETGEAPVEQAA